MPTAVRRLAVLLLLILLAGCSTADRMPGIEYPPRPPDWPVALWVHPDASYYIKRMIPYDHRGTGPEDAELIGEFSVYYSEWSDSKAIPLAEAISRARNRAREIGGDGVVIRDGWVSAGRARLHGPVLRYREAGIAGTDASGTVGGEKASGTFFEQPGSGD